MTDAQESAQESDAQESAQESAAGKCWDGAGLGEDGAGGLRVRAGQHPRAGWWLCYCLMGWALGGVSGRSCRSPCVWGGLRVVPTPAVAERGSPRAGPPAPAALPQCRALLFAGCWHERRGHLTLSKVWSICVVLLQSLRVRYYHEKANVILSITMNLFSSSYP